MLSPELLTVCLCLFSAVTVAATNFFVKKSGDILTSRSAMSMTMAALAAPFAFIVPLPELHHWPLLLMALLVHALYQIAMINALQRGDLSLVFPVMRGLGPLVVGVLGIFVLHQPLSVIGWAGLLLASVAVIVFAFPTATTKDARALDRAALLFAFLTALGIGCYSVTDAYVIRQMPNPGTFIVWLFLGDWIGVTTITLWRHRSGWRAAYAAVLTDSAIAGALGAASFTTFLYALSFSDAALSAALRETSVIFAAALGAIFLKEGFGARRILAATTMAIGLVMLQLAS